MGAGMSGKWGFSRFIVLVFVLIVCHGCTVGPDYSEPETILPDSWHQAATDGLLDGQAGIQTWWEYFNDPQLNDLIESAWQGNLDVKQAQSRVYQGRYQRAIAAGEKVPQIDAIGSFSRQRQSEGITPTLPGGISRTDNFYDIGTGFTWEIDVWGRVRRNIASADYSYEASVEDLRDILVILCADVAINYVQARTLQARIDYANKNVKRQEATLVLTSERFNAGLVPKLDVRQADLNLARTKSVIPSLTEALKQTIHRLGVLIGEEPSVLFDRLGKPVPIPKPATAITVGIPADIIRQRPDIRSAERQLASQVEQVGVATALLYPQFRLSGDFLFDSAQGSFAGIFRQRNTSWSFGPSFVWNLFDGDRIRSNIKFEEAVGDEAYFNYSQTVLEALEDVENNMVAYAQENKRQDELEDSVDAAQDSVDLVTVLYRTGLVDFQNVLDMERSLFQQQDELVSSQGIVVVNLINIYRALGGGWSPELEG
jgi:NodT family efflux transporter outer membrane factor (OMF) lipoprotein